MGLSHSHAAYVDALPREEDLDTPLWFDEEELDALKGSNLLGAVRDRRKIWREEWEDVVRVLADSPDMKPKVEDFTL